LQIRDARIMGKIERIGEHFRANISNRYIRPILLQVPLDKEIWDLLENLTEKSDLYVYQGYHMDELYRQVVAAARFVSVIRRDLVPNMRHRMNALSVDSDRVLRDMAVHNFVPNLKIFADMVNDLYHSLVELDKANAKGKKPLYQSMPQLEDVSRLLEEPEA